jgi:hypothetical protein
VELDRRRLDGRGVDCGPVLLDLNTVVDPTANDPFWGFLMVAGFGVGVTMAVVGAAIVAKAHGIKTPPI